MKDISLLFGIAVKDILSSFRSVFALVFMFGIPILVTVMFSFMFGGGEDSAQVSLPVTRVVVADLDEGSAAFTASLQALRQNGADSAGIDLEHINTLGALLAQTLQNDSLDEVMDASRVDGAAEARSLVDQQLAGVAVIIPPGFTQALMQSGGAAQVELYHDPTLTLGPQVVGSIVNGFLDEILRAPLGIQVIQQQLMGKGVALNQAQMAALASRLAVVDRQAVLVENKSGAEAASSPTSSRAAETTRQALTLIMGGMMVFYAFFTGANSVQSILVEEERGTLGRTFTAPVPAWCVLGGKFLAGALTVLVQVTLLMIFGALVFGIRWGSLASASLTGLGLVLASVSFGIFLISLLKNSNQVGIVFGGVMTITGMVGIFSVFTMGAPSARITESMALFVPQGWAMTALRRAVDGAAPLELAPFLLGLAGWSVVFFSVGVLRFRRRYS